MVQTLRKWNNKIKWHRLKTTLNNGFSYILHVIRFIHSLSFYLTLTRIHIHTYTHTQTHIHTLILSLEQNTQTSSVAVVSIYMAIWWLSNQHQPHSIRSSVLHVALYHIWISPSVFSIYFALIRSSSLFFSVFRRVFSVVSIKLEHISRMKFRHKRPWYYWRWNMGVRNN